MNSKTSRPTSYEAGGAQILTACQRACSVDSSLRMRGLRPTEVRAYGVFQPTVWICAPSLQSRYSVKLLLLGSATPSPVTRNVSPAFRVPSPPVSVHQIR